MKFNNIKRKTVAAFMLVGIMFSLMGSCQKGGCPGAITDADQTELEDTKG